jgi:predicted phosphoadenosine phosphosulfate sulfurtransferase
MKQSRAARDGIDIEVKGKQTINPINARSRVRNNTTTWMSGISIGPCISACDRHLKNDHLCKYMGFSQTKEKWSAENAMVKYRAL